MDEKLVDVSLLVTFHNEAIFAHSTLNSIDRCREYASNSGILMEYVIVLDSVDLETKNIIMAHPAIISKGAQVIEVDYKDTGLSRNAGIELARGTAIAVLDGDDYFSKNWIACAWTSMQSMGGDFIFHPEYAVQFGDLATFGRQCNQIDEPKVTEAIFKHNLWTSWSFGAKKIYLECPYLKTNSKETGFGFEDWHWNCEVIAAGYQHVLVDGTVGFYRRKKNSRVISESSMSSLIHATKLFDKSNEYRKSEP